MANNTLILKHDSIISSSGHAYTGKYTVGRLHLTDTFIVEYMRLAHGIEIPDSWVSHGFTNIPDINTRKVLYMECCDILSRETMNEIRDSVKSPLDGMKIYRNGDNVTSIQFKDDRNEITV